MQGVGSQRVPIHEIGPSRSTSTILKSRQSAKLRTLNKVTSELDVEIVNRGYDSAVQMDDPKHLRMV